MRSSFVRLVCRLLVACMIGLPFQVHAGLIGTDQVVTAEQALAARGMVSSVVSRADVASQLQSLGLSPEAAKDRVAALTDSEVTKLAGQIQNLPAGADATGLVVLILIGVLIWYLVKN
ncbi:MAG TPA: PA2779 family protein [Burkholderiales bacterium]|nr:PA2779 family protein [Burkholderiales bacterium]